MYRIRNADDYIKLAEQTLFEIGDLIACAEDEGEGESEFIAILPALRRIEEGLRAVQAEIKAGTHVIARDQPLPFMAVVSEQRRRLPIAVTGMLDALNLAHKNGFAES
jgi:hypothetical protein